MEDKVYCKYCAYKKREHYYSGYYIDFCKLYITIVKNYNEQKVMLYPCQFRNSNNDCKGFKLKLFYRILKRIFRWKRKDMN